MVRRLQREPSSFRATNALAPRVQTRPSTRRGVRLNRGNTTALVTEEALSDEEGLAALLRCVATQPPWSDLPFVVLAAARGDLAQGDRTPGWLNGIGNVV